jgi:hypothetical protein
MVVVAVEEGCEGVGSLGVSGVWLQPGGDEAVTRATQGELSAPMMDILQVMEARHTGTADAARQRRVDTCTDLDPLDRRHLRAITAKHADELCTAGGRPSAS